MKNENMKKLYVMLINIIILIILFAIPTFCIWGKTEKGGIFWVNSDNTFEKDGWKLIDDDNDGIAYYYYFNENGFILLDDITPDYMVVDKLGRRIDYNGNPVAMKVEKIDLNDEHIGEYSEEILAQIKQESVVATTVKGLISSGQSIFNVPKDDTIGPKPSDGLIIDDDPLAAAKTLLGKNVTLKEKTETRYDPSIDKNMVTYVKESEKFSKSINGTIYTKAKWKAAMALKGSGAFATFENPKNNFNKLKGRIATHNFDSSSKQKEDRTTICTLNIYNDDNNDLIYSTSDFNYNSGCTFECVFYQSVNAIRFELNVEGEYPSRVCYLRDCEYGFDRKTWEDEQYDKEVELAHIAIYGTESETDYAEEDEGDEYNEEDGEYATEGEDPGARYRRLHGTSTDADLLKYSEDDEELTDAMRASISELKRNMEIELEKNNKVSGPAFDTRLKDLKEAVGPNGESNIYKASEGN